MNTPNSPAVEVLSDAEIANALYRLIDDAKKELVLCSPYVQTWDRLWESVRRAIERGVRVILLTREETDGPSRYKQVDAAAPLVRLGASITPVPRLHAKIYFNENTLIVGSLNLMETSLVNSRELCFRVHRGQAPEVFLSSARYVIDLLKDFRSETLTKDSPRFQKAGNTSTTRSSSQRPSPAQKPSRAAAATASPEQAFGALIASAVKAVTEQLGEKKSAPAAKTSSAKVSTARRTPRARSATSSGACIRCTGDVPFNPDRPLCASCFASWARYQDPHYLEQVCHRCGRDHDTSFAQPLCYSCYRKSS